MDAPCRVFAPRHEIAAITNDIYTEENAESSTRAGSPPPERIPGLETGGCPHTAIREDASINPAGAAEMRRRFPDSDAIPIEGGGDDPAAAFSPEPADPTIHVVDASAGDKVPRKGGPGTTRGDRAGHQQDRPGALCGGEPGRDGPRQPAMRGEWPFVFADIRAGQGVAEVAASVERAGGRHRRVPRARPRTPPTMAGYGSRAGRFGHAARAARRGGSGVGHPPNPPLTPAAPPPL